MEPKYAAQRTCHNKKLMESCRELYEYAFLIEEIRKGLRTGAALVTAVDRAVEICINEGVLKQFLLRHRAEVKNVILEEFDWKRATVDREFRLTLLKEFNII